MNSISLKVPVLLAVIVSLFLFSCDDRDPRRIDYSTVPDPVSLEGAEKITTERGLVYYRLQEGVCPSGNEKFCSVNPTDQVSMFYTKRVKNDPDRILASSYANGNELPATTSVQNSRIISEEGFKQGIIGMKQDEIRVLMIPPSLAYGNNPNSSYQDDTIRVYIKLDQIVY